MALMRYEPWNMLEQMRKEMDQLFHRHGGEDSNIATSDWTPAVDIREEDDSFVIKADIPGVDAKDIEVHMENGMLSIKGQREEETREEREGYKRVERMHGSFYRRFSLPDTADADQVTAKSSNGVLELRIGKKEPSQTRKIEVKS